MLVSAIRLISASLFLLMLGNELSAHSSVNCSVASITVYFRDGQKVDYPQGELELSVFFSYDADPPEDYIGPWLQVSNSGNGEELIAQQLVAPGYASWVQTLWIPLIKGKVPVEMNYFQASNLRGVVRAEAGIGNWNTLELFGTCIDTKY